MKLLKTLISGCILAGFTLGQARAELRTTGSAIACAEPGKLQAAEDAAKKHDRTQMDILGCFPVMTGTVAKRIDDGKPGSLWHVKLDPNGPDPMEVWARPSSFHE